MWGGMKIGAVCCEGAFRGRLCEVEGHGDVGDRLWMKRDQLVMEGGL